METNIEIKKENLFYMEDGKKKEVGDKIIRFMCPQCKSEMTFFRVVISCVNKIVSEYECEKCGYQDEIDWKGFYDEVHNL